MRILVIEDEHKIARAIKRGLEQERFAVDLSFEGLDGLGLALTETYDLLIIDRMLPGVTDGVDICRSVREKGLHTPILLLTARDGVGDRVEGLNGGADDYLVKPFAFEELLARIRALLRRPEQTLPTVLRVGDLTLDTAQYTATRAGRSIELSVREYSLLEYLMRNAGRTLSKDDIIGHVWDYDADVLPNTVEVYVGYLRAKIDRPFRGPKLIETVRGFGYRMSQVEPDHVS